MTKKPSNPKKQLSAKQQASDDALRKELEHFDLKKFDKLMGNVLGDHHKKPPISR